MIPSALGQLVGPAPRGGFAATESRSSSPKLKVVLTLKLFLLKTIRVPQKVHGVREGTVVCSRRLLRLRNATEADKGSLGTGTDRGAPTGAPPPPSFPIARYLWSLSLPRDGSFSPQDSPCTGSPECSAGSQSGGFVPSSDHTVQRRRASPASPPFGRPWRAGYPGGLVDVENPTTPQDRCDRSWGVAESSSTLPPTLEGPGTLP